MAMIQRLPAVPGRRPSRAKIFLVIQSDLMFNFMFVVCWAMLSLLYQDIERN